MKAAISDLLRIALALSFMSFLAGFIDFFIRTGDFPSVRLYK